MGIREDLIIFVYFFYLVYIIVASNAVNNI